MLETFKTLNPVVQALLATLFTWGVTALGAALVFFAKTVRQRMMDGMLGFAAGVMIAASFWSLLAPSIEMAEELGYGKLIWIPPLVGFFLGASSLWLTDKILPHLHPGLKISEAEGIKTSWHRNILLVLAITLHNIPEGLAVGVAFGALAFNLPSATFAGAVALAIGIGIQNFPEGTIVSMPLRREGMSRLKSFWYDQLSGAVEPVAGVIVAAVVMLARPLLPYALACAAGAMIGLALKENGLHFVDVGTSAGVWGLTEGYSMMVGGDDVAVERLRPVLLTLAPAPDKGWGRVGPGGSGHFVKMVHTGIEYGLMEAYAEGFELMRRKEEFSLDLAVIAEIWRNGSVVRSWLLDLTARVLAENPPPVAIVLSSQHSPVVFLLTEKSPSGGDLQFFIL